MPDCAPGNILERLCGVEDAVAEILEWQAPPDEENIIAIADIDFSLGLSSLFSGGDWSAITGGIRSTAGGVSNKYRTLARFGYDRRLIKWNFLIGTAGGIAYFGTDPRAAQTPTPGVLIRVNATSNALELMDGWDGTTIGSILQSVTPDGFTITNGVEYELVMECKNRQMVFDLKPVEGAGLATMAHLSGPWTYTTFPTVVGYDAGTFQGSPCAFGASAVSLTLRRFRHYLRSKGSPLLAIFADSRIEGLNTPEGMRTVDYLRAALGEDEVVSSAIGGSNSTDIVLRMEAELPLINPDYVMFLVGANADSLFNANMTSLVASVLAAGHIPVICTEPTSAPKTAFVKTLTGARIVDYDTAVTSGGAGTSFPVVFYAGNAMDGGAVNDSVHLNYFGNKVLYSQIMVDIPELKLPPHQKFLEKTYQPFNPTAFRAHSNQYQAFPLSVENSYQLGFASIPFIVNQILIGYLRGDYGGNMALVIPGTNKVFSVRMDGDVDDAGSRDGLVVSLNGSTIQSGLSITRPANAANKRNADIFVSSPDGDLIMGTTLDNGTIDQAFGIRRDGTVSHAACAYANAVANTTTVPAGTFRVLRSGGITRLWANEGGVLTSVDLT